jgi:transcriptional regulator with XRE-family HTH domain
MQTTQDELIRLSETAEDLPDFLKQACKLMGISLRQASLKAGLSAGTIWNFISSHTKRGDEDTITKLALFFKVPEVNLMALAGYGRPQRVLPTYRLEEAETIWQVLTDEEKDKWIEYGELLIRGRQREEGLSPAP